MALERKLLKRTSVDQSTARDFTVCKFKFEFNPSTNMNSYSHTYLHILHVMHNQVKAFLKQHLNQFEFFKSFCKNGEKIHVPYGCHHNPQHVYYSIQGGFFIKSCTFVWLVFKTAFLNKSGICIYALMSVRSWSFLLDGSSKARFCSKINCSQMKLLYFVNWHRVGPTKIGSNFSKVVQKLSL